MNFAAQRIGQALTRYLAKPQHLHSTSAPADFLALAACLRPADVLLVEGHSKISSAVKYLTQSTWSHAALYVGDVLGLRNDAGEALCLIEADMLLGVRAVALSLRPDEAAQVVKHARRRLGHQYDLKNIADKAACRT